MTSSTTKSYSPSPSNSHFHSLRQDAATIALVGMAHAGSHFSQMMLAPLFPVFMLEFNLSFSQIGFLVSVLYAISSLGQASSGFAVDRFGARPVLFGSFFLFTCAALLAVNATSYVSLIAVMVLIGIGNAPFHPADFTIMNQRVSEARLGYAYSVHGVTGNLGWALAPVFFVGITALSNWRTAYVCATVLYLVILGVLYLHKDKIATTVVRTEAATDKNASSKSVSDFAFLKFPVVWWCFGFFMFATMTLAVIQSFSVSIVQKLHGVTLYQANATLTAYMLCAAAGMLVGGWVAAKFPKISDRVVARAMTAAAVLLVLAATGWLGGLGTCALIASTGFAIGVGGPSRDMMIKKAKPLGATGRVYGLVYSGMDVGFAIAPLVFGVMMDKGWYAATLIGAAVTLMIAVGLATGVGKRTEQR
jgi:MFS transporter, FSR family, fosmidomycin resistance protein